MNAWNKLIRFQVRAGAWVRLSAPKDRSEPEDLEHVLCCLESLACIAGRKVIVCDALEALGQRSFGPFLASAGLLGMTPLAAVPGAPTTLAAFTLLVSVQVAAGRDWIWLPRQLLKMRLSSALLARSLRAARGPVRAIDAILKPRLPFLCDRRASPIIALACGGLALLVPPLELIPLAAMLPSLGILMFGLGLMARDGLLVLAGGAVTASVLFMITRAVQLAV